ncbi:MAG: dipeptidase PepE [Planctomycetota bacterium]
MRLFLHSGGLFHEVGEELRGFVPPGTRILFVPYAGHDLDAYTLRVRGLMEPWGFVLEGIHAHPDPRRALEEAEVVFVGGGNTYRLLVRMFELDLIAPLRRRVEAGLAYVGSSAGSNLACPTIMTTNDMPIVRPPTFEALSLVPFQINPHYRDPDPESMHRGETREQRILQYHEMNETPVIGLREGSLLRREGDALELRGTVGARLFLRGKPPAECRPGDRLDFLLGVRDPSAV